MKKVLFLLILPFICSCSYSGSKPGDIPNHEYSEIADKQIKWKNVFDLTSDNYYVYCYFEHCVHCHSIKNEIIHIALNNVKNIRFCNDNDITISDGDPSQTVGKSCVDDIFIKGFPSVIKIVDHKITHNICGASKVLQFIKA